MNKAIHAHRATLRVPTSDGQGLALIASAGVGRSVIPVVRNDPTEAVARAFRSDKMMVVNDYDSYPTVIQSGIDEEIRSLAYLPVRNNDQVLGILSIGCEEPNVFSPEITSILDAYALALGVLLQSIAAEEALRESESKYKALVNQSPDMVFVSRIDDFRLVEVNDRACDYYGYSRDEFLALDIFDLENDTTLREEVTALYESTPVGQAVEVYGTNRRKDGTTFPVQVRFAKLDDLLAIANVRDITEAKRAEDSLRDSEARSKVLLEDAPQGIIVANDKGIIVRVNRHLENLFGYSREELVGRPVELLMPEASKAGHVALRAGYVKNPVARTMGAGLRLNGRRKDETEFPVEISLSAVDTSDGLLTIAHVSDDTIRRELEDLQEARGTRLSGQLEAREAEMTLADQVARIITSTLDIEQEYERFALEVKKLIDFDRMTLLDADRPTNSYSIRISCGLDIPSLRPGTNIPLEGSVLQRTMNSDERILVETLAPPFDSATLTSLFEAGLRSYMIVPLVFNDQITGGIAMLSRRESAFGDREKRIVERLASQIAPAVENARLFRQAQERTQEIQRLNESTNRILDSNPSALVVLRGSDREVVMVNSSFRVTFSHEKTQLEGRPISQVLDWVGLEERIRESMASPLGEGQKETRYLDHDGTERWFSVSAAPLLLGNDIGYREEVLLVLNDITEQRRQQERLQEQSRLASVGQLASGVAHEINNPLAAIHGYSELLQLADLPPQANEDARKIQLAVQRAAKIVQNLLSFARKSEPEKRYLSVASVVDQALALKARDFELENIRVTTHHSEDAPSTMVDEHQIIQVMLNILTNAEQAIKADQGRGEIIITTHLVNGGIRISVSDDGLGIPAENLHSIFDPFFTTKEVGEGTGLGLSICYGIVRDHGGKMWAESAPGKGAAFHIELPVLPNVAPADTQPAESDFVTVTARRILVVDDEPEVRNILRRVLTADGHDVALASDGQDAWKLIQKTRFDSIFLDLRMPGVDGRELYQQIIEYSSDLAKKVVFITGDTASADTERFLDSTASPVLGKPFTIEAIRQLL